MRTCSFQRAAFIAALGAGMALTQLAKAQSIEVIPPAKATVAGDINNYIPIGAGGGGTYQVLYPASQLVGLPIGGSIKSIQMRLRNAETTPWPAAASVISSYEIKLGGSTRTPATLSTTFADNITSPVIVRTGTLGLPAGAYPAGAATGSTPEDWGPEITLSVPYVYRGGPLVVEFRNTGAGTVVYADAVTSPDLGRAVATTVSNTATAGNYIYAVVMRLGVAPPNAQPVTLPAANENVAGFSGNYIPFAGSTGGRLLTLYATDQLAAVPAGSLIVGVQLRQRNAETMPYPSTAFTASDYEIWLCRSNLVPASISSTFADNIRDAILVRDGVREFAASEFPGGAASGTTPESWGPLMVFDTPYVYLGGVLGLEFRNTGGGPGSASLHFADIVANGSAAAGLASTASPTNPTGSPNGAIIARFTCVIPVESPFGDGVTKILAAKRFAEVGAGTFFVGFTRDQNFTAQYLFGPEQFQTVGPGTLLTGVAFRNFLSVAWPAALASYPQFDLRLSKSPLAPATMSTTVAANSGVDAITVRSGSLAVAAGSLAAKPTTGTAAFTWEVPFTQPYPYRSGTLDLLINNQPISVLDGYLDAVDAIDVPMRSLVRGQYAFGVGSLSVPNAANVPVTRYSADAQIMVPNTLRDGTGFTAASANSPFDTVERTFQQILGAAELTYLPIGSLITSISYANANYTPWPGATGAAADDYSIEISTAAKRPDSMSLTFAENVGPDALIVRSGPISWLPGALPSLTTGRFGGTITFDRGFVYKGGDLCITIRHSGVTSLGSIRTVNAGLSSRSTFNQGEKAASIGFFFGGDTSAAVQLGYVPSGVSPSNILFVAGTSGRFLFDGNRVYQSLYDADQVGVPVGAAINGVALRVNEDVANAFPASDHALDRFDITMSTGVTTASTMSATFAANEGVDLVTVRSGAITIPARFFPGHDAQCAFSRFIPFTRPFVYKGGPIVLTIRAGNVTDNAGSALLDAHSIGAQGVRNTSGPDALSGMTNIGALAARFAFTDDAFCPADLNNDGVVDDLDFQVFVLSYNILDCTDPGMALGCPGDFTFDRVVNDDDFLPFVQAYNAVLCP